MAATRQEVLDTAGKLLRQLKEAAANPFDQVSGTPALDALKLNGAVISDADLEKLLGAVEKAKTDQETWNKVAGAIGSLIGGLAKAAL